MKKPDKRDTINLFFSAFLIIAFIVCAHFFSQFTSTISLFASSVVTIILFVVFGLLLFYATRVGDGKAIKRFSLITLIILVIPSLYIIIASLAPGMPFNDVFASNSGGLSVIVILACVAFGYGVPYTFLSGFEVADEDAAGDVQDSAPEVLEGGVEADLINNDSDEIAEETTEETYDTDYVADEPENTEETADSKEE